MILVTEHTGITLRNIGWCVCTWNSPSNVLVCAAKNSKIKNYLVRCNLSSSNSSFSLSLSQVYVTCACVWHQQKFTQHFVVVVFFYIHV